MNRRELVGHIAEELGKVFPEGDEELEREDLDTVESVVEQVTKDAAEAMDEAEDEEEEPVKR